eukprot:3280069-Pyramimonas_sp.AAC.1
MGYREQPGLGSFGSCLGSTGTLSQIFLGTARIERTTGACVGSPAAANTSGGSMIAANLE